MEEGGKEMIDAPMLKQVTDQLYYNKFVQLLIQPNFYQAEKTIQEAKAAGLTIPNIAMDR